MKAKFRVGQQVEQKEAIKDSLHKTGVVVAVFVTYTGRIRYVVEYAAMYDRVPDVYKIFKAKELKPIGDSCE